MLRWVAGLAAPAKGSLGRTLWENDSTRRGDIALDIGVSRLLDPRLMMHRHLSQGRARPHGPLFSSRQSGLIMTSVCLAIGGDSWMNPCRGALNGIGIFGFWGMRSRSPGISPFRPAQGSGCPALSIRAGRPPWMGNVFFVVRWRVSYRRRCLAQIDR